MALFKRKKSDSLDAYYSPQEGGNKPLSLVLSILGLLVLAGLVVGIFFGSRWLYRTIKGDDNDNASVVTSSVSPRMSSSVRPTATPTVSPSKTPTPTPSKSATPTTTPKTMPNTGPEGPAELL